MGNGKRRSGRGLAMATTLYVVFVVLLFGLTLATMASFQYQFAMEAVNRGRSLEAAQSGMAQAIYNLSTQPTWGRTSETVHSTVATDNSLYTVTFDASQGAPWSVNNLAGSSSVPGYLSQAVPAHSALILSQGSAPNATGALQKRTVEAVLQFAAYPYAVAASDKVDVNGSLSVNGSSQLTQVLAKTYGTAASVYAGSNSSGAVRAGALTNVSGKVRTPGGVTLTSPYTVAGGVETNVQAETLPDVDIRSMNNSGLQGVTMLAPDGTYALITGPTYVNGNVTLLGAVLVNASLYVDGGGNLTSLLGLTGTGSIYVTGKTDLEGAANVVINSGIAIFSQGDLTVTGGSYFQGVLYSHGDVTARSPVNVLGAVIAQGGKVSMAGGTTVTYVPEYTQFGSNWSGQNMNGSLVTGTSPLLKTLFWREMP